MYIPPTVSYEVLKLDGYSSPFNGYLRESLSSRLQATLSSNRQFFQNITNLLNVAQNCTCFSQYF